MIEEPSLEGKKRYGNPYKESENKIAKHVSGQSRVQVACRTPTGPSIENGCTKGCYWLREKAEPFFGKYYASENKLR
jgi:hypothetical protein